VVVVFLGGAGGSGWLRWVVASGLALWQRLEIHDS